MALSHAAALDWRRSRRARHRSILPRRESAKGWPLLDAARQRLGDPEASRRKRRHNAVVAAERERMARVVDDLSEVADDEYTWLAAHADGIACVIGDPTFRATARVRSLTPELSKGLEFDLVVLIDPEAFGRGIEGAVDRYVAMTRATQRLVILRTS